MDQLILKEPAFAQLSSVSLDFCSIAKTPDVALVGAIIGQRISYFTARKYRTEVYKALGTNYLLEDVLRSPVLREKLPAQTWTTIEAVHKYIGNRPLTAGDVPDLELQISGIGPWTVQVTLLTINPELDVFPPGDLFLKKRLQKLLKLPKLPSDDQVKTITAPWSPCRGIATWYLWRWF